MDGMTIFNNILFWLHLTALAMGGAATFGIPVVGSKMAGASAETRPVLFAIMKGISGVSRAALGILLITGPLMVWLKFGGVGGFNTWFWIKMVLVLILFAGVIYSGVNFERAVKGDVAAAKRGPQIGMVLMVTLLAIILTAVFAFE
jgi:putative membrane protein